MRERETERKDFDPIPFTLYSLVVSSPPSIHLLLLVDQQNNISSNRLRYLGDFLFLRSGFSIALSFLFHISFS